MEEDRMNIAMLPDGRDSDDAIRDAILTLRAAIDAMRFDLTMYGAEDEDWNPILKLESIIQELSDFYSEENPINPSREWTTDEWRRIA